VADLNSNCFSFEQVEGKDFKFNLKVTVTREAQEFDEEDAELQEIIGDDEEEDEEVQIAMEVRAHPTDKEQIALVFRQNGENWVDNRDFSKAMLNLGELFAEFANEE